MPATTFVTGGSGVVGRPIVARLVARGESVTALARSEAARRTLEALGAQPAEGDLQHESLLAASMRGCDVVYHAAGLNGFCLPDPSQLQRVNVLGTMGVVRAAARAGVRRIVYTSSAAAIGEVKGTVAHERSAHRGSFLSEYERSKFEAEKVILDLAAAAGIEVVCVNPSSVQGPGRAGGTARLLRLYIDGKLRFFVDTTISLVDIDDCAEGHLRAAARGVAGERYILNGATLSTSEALALVARITGVAARPRVLPAPAAVAAAGVVEAVARIRRRSPSVCREMVRTMLHGHAYDGSLAERELGLSYTPVEVTLRRTVEWFARAGLLERPPPGPG
ncbi:MAG: NAD-dependent epimerase/dehydratase family protein [Actinomycetota bacterium]